MMSPSSSSSLQLLPEEEDVSVELISVPEPRLSSLFVPLLSRNGSQLSLIKFGVAFILSEPWGLETAILFSVVPEGSLDVELLKCSLNADLEVPDDGELLFSSIGNESVETASAQDVAESPELAELLLLIFRSKVLACLCFCCIFLKASACTVSGSSTLSEDFRKSLLAALNLFRECKEELDLRPCVLPSLLGTGGGSLLVGVSGKVLEHRVGETEVFVTASSFDIDVEMLAFLQEVFVRDPSSFGFPPRTPSHNDVLSADASVKGTAGDAEFEILQATLSVCGSSECFAGTFLSDFFLTKPKTSLPRSDAVLDIDVSTDDVFIDPSSDDREAADEDFDFIPSGSTVPI